MMRGFVGKRVGEHLPVKHLLVGHGAPLHDDPATALATAYSRRLRDWALIPKGLRAFRKSK